MTIKNNNRGTTCPQKNNILDHAIQDFLSNTSTSTKPVIMNNNVIGVHYTTRAHIKDSCPNTTFLGVRFIAGKKYKIDLTFLDCSSDYKIIEVIARTEKTITIKDGSTTYKKRIKRNKKHEYATLGNYSISPILRADEEFKTCLH